MRSLGQWERLLLPIEALCKRYLRVDALRTVDMEVGEGEAVGYLGPHQSFVSGIADSSESAAIVHTLVQPGLVLELKTIAQRIEDHDRLKRLERNMSTSARGSCSLGLVEEEGMNRLLTNAAGKVQRSPSPLLNFKGLDADAISLVDTQSWPTPSEP